MMAIAAAQQTNNSIKIVEKKIMQMCPENFPLNYTQKKKILILINLRRGLFF